MTVRKEVSLRELTTFKVGGLARYVCDCDSKEDVVEAIALAQREGLSFVVLGEGSNVLPKDEGYDGVVLRIGILGIEMRERGEDVLVTVGAGVAWERLVDVVTERGLWGIENLSGIPGTVGAAPVQNIGAYGAELESLFVCAQVYDTNSNSFSTYSAADCVFAYRDSVFKHNRALVITEVTLRFSITGAPRLGYSDLAKLAETEAVLDTPVDIRDAVRSIRSKKFPDLRTHGTAGSFFKNPVLSPELFASLSKNYGAIPSFPNPHGIKVPLAFILDHILNLRGYTRGNVSLFGNQPLVVVAERTATAEEINTFAKSIEEKVFEKTKIKIEREVQTI